jgi:hypothetical protein
MRTNIAFGICFVSVAIGGYLCLFQHLNPLYATVNLWIIWGFTADWLGCRLWMLHLRPKEIVKEAKHGKLRLTGVALGINRASYVWAGAAAYVFFK